MKTDVLVIGGGLAGLSAALSAQRAGVQTTVLATGMGVLYLGSGCIDLMAYPGGRGDDPVSNPREAIRKLRLEFLDHPYARVSEADLDDAITGFVDTCREQDLDMIGDGNTCRRIPTALGTAKPTGLVQATLEKGDLSSTAPMTLVGFSGLRDFFPDLPAQRLAANFGIDVRVAVCDPREAMGVSKVNTVSLGRAFESRAFCEHIAQFINNNARSDDRVGLPAVLGVDGAAAAHRALSDLTSRLIFEMPILPPSLPGRRVYQALRRAFFELGGQMINGCPVLRADVEKRSVRSVVYRTGEALEKTIRTGAVILATGSFFSGGLICLKETIHEPIFNLPVCAQPELDLRYSAGFLDKRGHPIGRAGIMVDEHFSPSDPDGQAVVTNLFACGDLLGGFDSLVERCGGGVALVSGTVAGRAAAKAVES